MQDFATPLRNPVVRNFIIILNGELYFKMGLNLVQIYKFFFKFLASCSTYKIFF